MAKKHFFNTREYDPSVMNSAFVRNERMSMPTFSMTSGGSTHDEGYFPGTASKASHYSSGLSKKVKSRSGYRSLRISAAGIETFYTSEAQLFKRNY
jgi:hypothetical protein